LILLKTFSVTKPFSVLSRPSIHIKRIDVKNPTTEFAINVKNEVSTKLYIEIGTTNDNADTGNKGNIILTKYVRAGKSLSRLKINTLTNNPTTAKTTDNTKVL
jgi:hypothetical protein